MGRCNRTNKNRVAWDCEDDIVSMRTDWLPQMMARVSEDRQSKTTNPSDRRMVKSDCHEWTQSKKKKTLLREKETKMTHT